MSADTLCAGAHVELLEFEEAPLDPDQPIPYRPIAVDAELARERALRIYDRKAAAKYISGLEEELSLALRQRDEALRFILRDKVRATEWVTRGGK